MTRGRNSRAQNRGCKYRMSPEVLDGYAVEMESLAAELGVPTLTATPEEPHAEPGLSFGLPEAMAVLAVFATAGLLNFAF